MNRQDGNHPSVIERTPTRIGQNIRETADQLGETAARASEGLEGNIENIGAKFNDARTSVFDKTKEYVMIRRYVRHANLPGQHSGQVRCHTHPPLQIHRCYCT